MLIGEQRFLRGLAISLGRNELLENIVNILGRNYVIENFLEGKDSIEYLGTINSTIIKKYTKITFSQSGEDSIIHFIFSATQKLPFTYIDVGAFDPFTLSNTALFYMMGMRGINIEPNPDRIEYFNIHRKEDTNLNIGISDTRGDIDYYFMDAHILNTFSKVEAEKYCIESGHKIERVQKVHVETLECVINTHCKGLFPDLLSLDAEGIDKLILESINYGSNYPKVIVVETIAYRKDGTGKKDKTISEFLVKKGYFLFADTYINSIFVYREWWLNSFK